MAPHVNQGQQRRRQKMIDAALPLLPPGTQIRQVIGGRTRPSWLFLMLLLLAILPGAILFFAINRFRMLAVTDDAIYVLDCGALYNPVRVKRVVAVLPRATRLGPPTGDSTKFKAGAMTLYLLGGQYRDQILAADATAVALAPDGRAWWDGSRWIDCETAAPPTAARTPDGAFWWDGQSWRPVPRTDAQAGMR